MRRTATRSRVRITLVALLVGATALGPAVVAGGDAVSDARVEARRIADELDRLQMRESVLGEDFDQAQLALSDLRQRVTADRRQVARTRLEMSRRRNELRHYAVAAYTSGNDDSLQVALHSGGNDLGRQLTYESVSAGDQADLIDNFETARTDQAAAVEHLVRAQDAAAAARNDLDRKRKAVTALVAEQQHILSRVQGRLKALVARAEAERAAAAAAAIHAAAVQAAAKARATAPPAPPPPPIVRRSRPRRAVQQTIHRVLAPPSTGPRQPASTSSTTTLPVPTTAVPAPPTTPVPTAPPATTPVPPAPTGPPPTPVPTPGPRPPPAGAADVIRWAETRLGSPYVWGAAGPNAFDCSGLVLWSFAQAGRGGLPHSSRAMYAMSRHLPLSALQPGDLVFFGQPVHHVGIYIGGGTMIDALNSRTPVAFHSIYGISETPMAGRI